MTRSDLVYRLAELNPHLYHRDAVRIVDAIVDAISEALERGDRVELRGFGTFGVKTRPTREGRNPKTGQTVIIATKYFPYFHSGKELRRRLNSSELT